MPKVNRTKVVGASCDSGSMVYFVGAIGSAIYFIQAAGSFGAGVVGVLKALVWPAYLTYNLFKFLLG